MAWEILYTKLIRKIGLFKLLLMVIFLFWGTHGIGKGLAMCLLVYCVCVCLGAPLTPLLVNVLLNLLSPKVALTLLLVRYRALLNHDESQITT